jgi:putative PIG3 family NAD(P)H quinone oxidoreductase
MRAISIQSPGGPEQLKVQEVPMPEPGPGQVRVRVHFAGINRADLLQRRGLYPAPAGFDSARPGLEFSGIVDALGAGCTRFSAGDAVMGLIGGGAYADYVVLGERELIAVPAGLSLREAAAIPEAVLTAYDAVCLQGGLPAGGACLIRAITSGVGIAACQLLKALGYCAIGTSRSAERAARLMHLKPDGIGVEGRDDIAGLVNELTHNRGVDVILDLVGGPQINAYLGMLAPRGTLMLVGIMGGGSASLELGTLLRKRLRIQGTVMRTRDSAERSALAARFKTDLEPLLVEGHLRPLIDSEFPLAEAPAAHRRIEANQHFGKVILNVAGM